MKKIKEIDKIAHVILLIGLVVGAVAIYSSRFSATRQLVVILLLIAFYLIWGYVYHHLRGDASRKLMIEYLVIGSIALLTSIFVFFL